MIPPTLFPRHTFQIRRLLLLHWRSPPLPIPSPTPSPTPSPSASPSASANPTAVTAPKASASLSKRVISIYAVNTGSASVIAMIDAKIVKIGKNTVTPGKHKVSVFVGGRLIYSRTFTVK